MVKKFTLLLEAAAVVAFAIPSLASASALTTSKGEVVKVGTALTATGTNIIQTSSTLGAIPCEKLTVKFTLTRNSEGTVEGSGTAETPFQQGCKNGTKAVVFTSFTVTKFFTNTSGKGTFSFTATEDIGELTCKLTGTNIPFTYTAGTGTIVFSSATGITQTPAACGTEKLDGSFLLETSSGGSLILD